MTKSETARRSAFVRHSVVPVATNSDSPTRHTTYETVLQASNLESEGSGLNREPSEFQLVSATIEGQERDLAQAPPAPPAGANRSLHPSFEADNQVPSAGAGSVVPVVPGSLDLDHVLRSVYKDYPLLQIAVQQRVIAEGDLLSASGEFAQSLLDIAVQRQAGMQSRVDQGDLSRIELTDNERLIVSRRVALIDSQRKFQQSGIKLSLFL